MLLSSGEWLNSEKTLLSKWDFRELEITYFRSNYAFLTDGQPVISARWVETVTNFQLYFVWNTGQQFFRLEHRLTGEN